MAVLDAAAVRQWVRGMREAEQVAWQIGAERLRRLSVFDSVIEYCVLKDEARRRELIESGEVWRRHAAAEYGRLLTVFRKAAARYSGR